MGRRRRPGKVVVVSDMADLRTITVTGLNAAGILISEVWTYHKGTMEVADIPAQLWDTLPPPSHPEGT